MSAEHGARTGRSLIVAGIAAIAVLFLVYGRYQDPALYTPDAVDDLQRMADGFYLAILLALGAVGYGMYRYHRAKARSGGTDRIAVIAVMTWGGNSRRIFVVIFVAYGIFFSLASGTIVYQPDLIFSYHYNVEVPGVEIAPCCDAPGYMPKILVYVTENVGLQVIPINMVLQVTVSYLVGLNAVIAVRAYSSSHRRRGLGGVGAVTGLFIACPTCAGSALSIFLGTAGSIVLTAALVQLQTLLIAVTIPVLLATPFLLTRGFTGTDRGCVVRND